MVFDTIKFISVIKEHPEIYDTSHQGFKSVDDKNEAFEKIAETFKVDCEWKEIV